jgi:hypothetical protein
MKPPPGNPYLRPIVWLASLKLTVVLLALSIVLIFMGTLAQVDQGIWAVMDQYFRTIIAQVELDLVLPRGWVGRTTIPFPGGWLLGGLLMMNLAAALVVRFGWHWRRSGLLLIHLGLAVLLLSELVTGLYADEGQMTIPEGGAANFTEDIREVELALVDRSGRRADKHHVVSERLLSSAASNNRAIEDSRLPVRIEVVRFMPNSIVTSASMSESWINPATRGLGRRFLAVQRDPVAGTDTAQTIDMPAAYVELIDRQTGRALGTYLVTTWLSNRDMTDTIEAGGNRYELSLRFRRAYKPYTLHALQISNDHYVGTNIPRNFSTRVRVVDPVRGQDRQFVIRMNQPLRYAGDTYYQSQMAVDESTTTFQVVRNPGWLLPYFACAVMTLGLVVQFAGSFWRFSARGGGA